MGYLLPSSVSSLCHSFKVSLWPTLGTSVTPSTRLTTADWQSMRKGVLRCVEEANAMPVGTARPWSTARRRSKLIGDPKLGGCGHGRSGRARRCRAPPGDSAAGCDVAFWHQRGRVACGLFGSHSRHAGACPTRWTRSRVHARQERLRPGRGRRPRRWRRPSGRSLRPGRSPNGDTPGARSRRSVRR